MLCPLLLPRVLQRLLAMLRLGELERLQRPRVGAAVAVCRAREHRARVAWGGQAPPTRSSAINAIGPHLLCARRRASERLNLFELRIGVAPTLLARLQSCRGRLQLVAVGGCLGVRRVPEVVTADLVACEP